MSIILRKLRGKKKKSSSRADDSAGPSEQPHSTHYEEPTTDIAEEDVSHAPQHHNSHDDNILLIDSQGGLTKRRGKATCQDIRDLPPDKRVLIEINDECQPCNIPESILLASYLGVIAKDCVLAPISFLDWRNPGLEPYKRQMLEDVERAQRKALDILNTVGVSNSVLKLIERRHHVDKRIAYAGMMITVIVMYFFWRWTH